MSGFAPSVKVFRGKVALQVEATKTAVTENRPVAVPTVTWTGAREKHAGAGRERPGLRLGASGTADTGDTPRDA